jgi:hypothetical protein
LHGTAHHVETLVRLYRRAQEAEALSKEARQQANRCFSAWYDHDGCLVLRGRLPPLAGAMLKQALEAAMEQLPDEESNDERPPNRPARRADALALMAEKFLQRGARSAPQTADRYQVVVHVDAETLHSGVAGRCEIEHGPALPAETVRRLACDASLVTILENDAGEPLDVGRKTRSIPPAIRRALQARDQGCRFPGCTHRRFLDAHHIQHWADGGATKFSNLLLLCRFHHRHVHEDGVTVERLADGALRFMRADGRAIDGCAADDTFQAAWTEISDEHLRLGIDIDARTAATRWGGERMDYGLAVGGLLWQARHAADVGADVVADVAAETSHDG